MKKYILTVTLNPAIDKTINISSFSIGKDFRESALTTAAGGKGINVSRVLKHLNTPSIASGFLGASSGDYIRNKN